MTSSQFDTYECHLAAQIAERFAVVSEQLEAAGWPLEDCQYFLLKCISGTFLETPYLAFKNLDGNNPASRNSWETGIDDEDLTDRLYESRYQSLSRKTRALLSEACDFDWRRVDPAVLGILLRRALDPKRRETLARLYTDQRQVDQLVTTTIIEPLRDDWKKTVDRVGDPACNERQAEALEKHAAYLSELAKVIVLDPACGTGLVLCAAYDHMKRLEQEVRDAVSLLSSQCNVPLTEKLATITPAQFKGIDWRFLSRDIAELVLWMKHLQWQERLGISAVNESNPWSQPREESGDAVLTASAVLPLENKRGQQIMRWDGRTFKEHPVTGEVVPDHKFRLPEWRYIDPCPEEWPMADFIVGKLPLVSSKRLAQLGGQPYVEALQAVHVEVPADADYAMYWWNYAARYLRDGWPQSDVYSYDLEPPGSSYYLWQEDKLTITQLRRFGFVTPDIRKPANRQVVRFHMTKGKLPEEPRIIGAYPLSHIHAGIPIKLTLRNICMLDSEPLSLVYVALDQPWVSSDSGEEARVSITVASAEASEGRLITSHIEKHGKINASFRVGPDVESAVRIPNTIGLARKGVAAGNYLFSNHMAKKLGLGTRAGAERLLRRYLSGREVMQEPQDSFVLDLSTWRPDELRPDYPELWAWLINANPEPENLRQELVTLRDALLGLKRFIVTPLTARHRIFQFESVDIIPGETAVYIATESAFALGVLSSRFHSAWASAAVAGDFKPGAVYARYDVAKCFETFAFPEARPEQKQRIAELAEQIDSHRKERHRLHMRMTLTLVYDVMEKIRLGKDLTVRDQKVLEDEQVELLWKLHDELDMAVADAYGWPADITEEDALGELLKLNHQRGKLR